MCDCLKPCYGCSGGSGTLVQEMLTPASAWFGAQRTFWASTYHVILYQAVLNGYGMVPRGRVPPMVFLCVTQSDTWEGNC